MSWSPFQREVLDAMGLSPYRLAGAGSDSAPPPRDAADGARAQRTPDSSRDPLLTALLRAAGQRVDGADAATWAARWPSPQSLRGDARAKRALWPQLRALRRRPQ